MVLRIDKNELESHIYKHKDIIGNKEIPSIIGEIAGACITIFSIMTTPMPIIIQGILFLIALFLIYDFLRLIIKARKHPYTAQQMIEDIVKLDKTERRSSIIAIRDNQTPSRYLVYKDTGWDCDFFPNTPTREPQDNDAAHIYDWLEQQYGISKDNLELTHKGHNENAKPSTEHNGEIRYYTYNIYNAQLKSIPPEWEKDTFAIGDRQCAWKTLDQMLSDAHTQEINGDVLSFVKQYQ